MGWHRHPPRDIPRGDYDDRRMEYAGRRCGCYGPTTPASAHTFPAGSGDTSSRLVPATPLMTASDRSFRRAFFSAAANLRLPRQKARSRHDYFAY